MPGIVLFAVCIATITTVCVEIEALDAMCTAHTSFTKLLGVNFCCSHCFFRDLFHNYLQKFYKKGYSLQCLIYDEQNQCTEKQKL